MSACTLGDLCFDDIEKGQGYLTSSRTVTERDVLDFAKLTGDHNRLHTDPEYAKGTAFGAPIAHGLLTLSVANGLYMQLGIFEKYTVANLGTESWNFKKPVFYGDTLHAHLMLDSKRQTSDPRRGVIRWKVSVINQKGESVADGIWVKMFLTRAAVDSVVLGSAFHAVHCNNLARYAVLSAGLPYETSATFMEMQCGSGIAAINHAAMQIMCGMADVAIAGGGESYSQRFAKFSMAVEPYKMIAPAAVPNFLAPEKEDQLDMIKISDGMAKRWDISRQACDEFALRSQQLAGQAIDSGWFDGEIVPVEVPARSKKEPGFTFDKDEHPRPSTDMESLAKLRAVNADGVTTAGNASGRNDGAAALLLMSADKAKELGLTPIARWVAGADVGVDPKVMGIGPVFSNLKTLKLAGVKLDEIDVFECNEAFAAQNLACIRELENQTGSKIDMNKWNPNGGAIAFGHPNAASGGRIAIAAVRQLERRGGRYGLVSSCCGGGLGVSALFERI